MKSSTSRRTIAIAALALLAALAPATARQAAPPYKDSKTIPDTPAYKRAQEIALLINGEASVTEVEAYMTKNCTPQFLADFPLSEVTGYLDQVQSFHGTLEVSYARSYEPPRPATNAVLIVRGSESEAWQAIVVDVEEAEPHRIATYQLAPARPPSDLQPAEILPDPQIAEKLSAYVDRLAAKDAFSGTVLLAKDGKVFMTKAAGIANRDFDAKVNLDTKFNLGSMNKMMTAVACMQLVEAGKLSLEDPVSKHLGNDWLPKVDKKKVRLKHLLTHTSGLGSYFTDEWDRASRTLYRTVDDWKPIIKNDTLAFEPGTRWQYSNTGMLVAGAIIEKVSGVDYYQYIPNHSTWPAGMTKTDFFETHPVTRNLPVGYEKQNVAGGRPIYRNNLYRHVVRGGPAGGGYSTVTDLLKFDQALRSEKLVKRASLDQLWRAYPELKSEGYGLGFSIETGPAGRIVGHTGGFTGISAGLALYLDAGYTIAVLSNYGGVATVVESRARELIQQGRVANQ